MASLQQTLLRQISRANRRFGLIEDGDKIMVAISGGKDSWAMLHLLREYRRMVPFAFTWVAVNLDQGHPGFPVEVLRAYLEREGHEHRIVHVDTYSVVKREVPAGKAYCSLCSRLRRGILYDVAVELGCTKIALGHHRDDLIETLLLNQLYAGQLKAMAPRLRSDDGRNTIIRPLILCEERDLAAYAVEQGFPVVPCDLCGSQDNLRRVYVRQLLTRLEADNPDVRRSLLAAAGNVKPSHLLDARLQGEGDDDGEPAGASDVPLISPRLLVRT
ncbi:tRNA s(2)C-32 sulfurtransferase [Nannocystis exedens]|uniref:tRNA s(2)C-32 sulfurtransferase n=1 Tax=Nannocystis exedens TaxID=54 RepID=A0A1I1VSU3_9BACT|nr:tRNA 2-thiocytidine(32) synthetase TtcA [Nannocystis exedens]PCC72738.1 tRNA 2-thiocytidine biosynthesis protein TtcA [Nannocystis exedens]SFD85118.1 tRNA s(2)C-32 sulfurtransferase [Nannocystis exedens]